MSTAGDPRVAPSSDTLPPDPPPAASGPTPAAGVDPAAGPALSIYTARLHQGLGGRTAVYEFSAPSIESALRGFRQLVNWPSESMTNPLREPQAQRDADRRAWESKQQCVSLECERDKLKGALDCAIIERQAAEYEHDRAMEELERLRQANKG